jgi:hypothetical protein
MRKIRSGFINKKKYFNIFNIFELYLGNILLKTNLFMNPYFIKYNLYKNTIIINKLFAFRFHELISKNDLITLTRSSRYILYKLL